MKNFLSFGVLAILLALSFFVFPLGATPTRVSTITPSNDTVLNSNWTYINYTLGTAEANITNCTLTYNNGTAHTINMSLVTHSVSSGYCYFNASAQTDTPYGIYYNYSISVKNESGTAVSDTGLMRLKIDTTDPSLTANTRYLNDSTQSYLELNTTVTENNIGTVLAEVFWDDDSMTTYDLTSYNVTAKDSNAEYYSRNITTPNIQGYMTIRYWANDTSTNSTENADPRSAFTTNNDTALVSYLRASSWNFVTVSGEYTSDCTSLSAYTNTIIATKKLPWVIGCLPGVTQIAKFNNDYDWKNFTTYATSSPTVNNGTTAKGNITNGNATAIYNGGSTSYYWFRNTTATYVNNTLYKGANSTQDSNLSVNKTSWSLLGIEKRKTLNQTIYWGSTLSNAGQSNVSDASWYNATDDVWIGCTDNGWTYCTGTDEIVNETYLPRGQGVWLLITNNITVTGFHTGF